MAEFVFPSHDNTIVNLTCSILQHFSLQPPHPTLPLADRLLEGNYRHIVLLVLDGMGEQILARHLAPEGFFRSSLTGCISSTFPPTTVAATTALQSGRYPIETGWLGWDCYFPMLDRNVVYFRNTDQQGNPISGGNAAYSFYPFTHICDSIRDAGYDAHIASPYVHPFPESFGGICERIQTLCAGSEETFVYAYWPEPDHVLHYNGCGSWAAGEELRQLEQQVQLLAAQLRDTLLLVTADHGHMDCRGEMITDYEDLWDCLRRPPSIEPRAMNLFVRQEEKQRFDGLFQKYFGDRYTLLPREEVLRNGLFGPETPLQAVRDMLGDYVAVATGPFTLYYTEKDYARYKSTHGGLTEAEMTVPLIAIGCK